MIDVSATLLKWDHGTDSTHIHIYNLDHGANTAVEIEKHSNHVTFKISKFQT